MFTTLRMRLLIGLAPLLALVVALGVWAIVMFARLGGNIDVILRENYRSVLYAERMKEALERMDSALLFALGGEERRAREQFAENRPVFEEQPRRRAGQPDADRRGGARDGRRPGADPSRSSSPWPTATSSWAPDRSRSDGGSTSIAFCRRS